VEALGFTSFENLTGVSKGFDRRHTEGDESRTLARIVELVDAPLSQVKRSARAVAALRGTIRAPTMAKFWDQP
jgi:hypothetical protein